MYKINKEDTLLLVIDMQEKLSAVMNEEMLETVVNNSSILAASFQKMDIPIIESLQYPKGLGDTVEDLRGELEPVLRFEKTSFSCAENKDFLKVLKDRKIKTVVIIGMEAHVCVLQTAVDLILLDYNVHIVADAIISRNDFNWEAALDYMQKAGAVITVTETVIFQLLKSSDAPEFKAIQELLK